MKPTRLFIRIGGIGALGILFLTGCMFDSQRFSDLNRRDGQTPGVHLDPDLSSGEAQKVTSDLSMIQSRALDAKGVKYFSTIFGGSDASGVEHYLEERVHWIVSPRKDLDRTVVSLTNALGVDSTSSPQVVATNIGAAIWFGALVSGDSSAGIQIGPDLVEIHSTRAGVIQLGSAYSSDGADPLLRVSTLIHEARHSDCTGGVSKQDLALLKSGKDPLHKDCGHLHATCPAGHPYAGYPACDDHAWGAYAVEADYMAAVAKTCLNCSALDQRMATLVFADAASRVLDLDGMLSGKYGAPDMTSTDAVHP